MSRIILTAAIRGSHAIVNRVAKKVEEAIEKFGPDQKVELPNTGYYLPIIWGILGIPVTKLGDMPRVVEYCKNLLPPIPDEKNWLPYLGPGLDAGMATLLSYDMEEALKYLEDPLPYLPLAEDCDDEHLWLGAADDRIMRKRGVEFVDGTAPGFAAIVGAAPDNETAVKIAKELQEKNLYVFMASDHNGVNMAEQLKEEGVQLGWTTRLVPFGKDTSAAIHAMGFATRVAMAFGGVKPGDYVKILRYNKNRVFAFVMALGHVTDEWYAAAAGCINWGFPTIADSNIPQILPTGVCTYEHVVSNVPHDQIVSKAIEVRGLKIQVAKVPVPVSYGPAFEGERIGKDAMHVELAGPKAMGVEFCTSAPLDEVQDGKIELVGPDFKDMEEGSRHSLGILVTVAGRKMQEDFEPILERQIHHFLNWAEGVLHIGQRDIIWLRISKKAMEKGFSAIHFGKILHARFHSEFNNIVDKIQVNIYTEEDKVKLLLDKARTVWKERDERLAGLTDDAVDTFYSCTLCQSFAPNHVCIITPERPGLCGAYNWLDGKAAYEINPTGPNQPVKKGEVVDEKLGKWKGVDEFVYPTSHNTIQSFSAYSIMNDPMTSCGCFECITVVLPMANGVMIVDRDSTCMTPCGMTFSTLAGTVGGGLQTPGFIGMSKFYIGSKKFISADGGFKRIVWMPKALKEQLKDMLVKRSEEIGIPDFYDKIATEEDATTEEEVIEFMNKVGHPALEMEPMM
ncbi:MAG: CO dehydrogenase/CO-methylating acetyl-CoA synthase complex subunit beta [Deltaproteobacteria bacterium]|nr:CO dehydrogenase/CO-methylating acetyl-CoA synthase complex subunit beta [Deltaproteobacteria bacterium]